MPGSRRAGTAAGGGDWAPVYAALGDATRLGLIARLCGDGPQSIAALTSSVAITRQAVTKHLRVMERAGLVRRRRRGRESVWEVEQRRLADARRHLERISTAWDQTLERLKRHVER